MKRLRILTACIILPSLILLFTSFTRDTQPRRLEILFLGHTTNRHHNSEMLADIFTREFFKKGINISFTTDPDDLNERNLSGYDGLILYANHDSISPSQEKALLNFVRSGKGFIPLHCASYCFRNSPEVVEMIGGQFKSHQYDSFPAVIVDPAHPVMKGIPSFYTKDETYVHDKISPNIEVLTQRLEGNHAEPYTWVRPFGNGRVFYTAYGHDENTFRNQAFLDLVYNGILWAVGDRAGAELAALTVADPAYFDGPVPNYEHRDPPPRVQQSLTPQQSMSLIQVPVGFELQLFAAEPDIVNPIYMNWDERGRLWVIETVDYPNEISDEDKGDDRIKILEDTDNDGKADKITVFADGLNIPTSFVFSNGGIIVSQAPSFLFLKDTNGDDKADIRENMLTGWGKSDTHAQASNLRYGLDNNIWGVVGYSGFYNGKKGRDSMGFGNGLYRFRPDGSKLEFLAATSNNTWGLGFSEEFDVFVSTANNTHTAFFGLPKRYYDKVKSKETGIEKLDAHYSMHVATKNLRQVDVHGGFTAAAGHSLYTARDFPSEYWNRVAFITEPTGRLIHRAILQQQGAGFREDGDGWNMLVSADEWAAPIQAEVGPDGALWITDWYDFIIQHNPTPSVASSGMNAENGKGNAYINPLRDHERGRIYRMVYKQGVHKNKTVLDKNDTKALVQALRNTNMFWRLMAQRLLVEKQDTSVLPDLYELVQDESRDEIGLNPAAIHALWTIHGLKALDGKNAQALEIVSAALHHPVAGVRRAAIEALPKTAATLKALKKENIFLDKDYRVRLAAILALADMKPSAEIGNLLVSMAEKEENITDTWLRQALMVGSKLNNATFVAAFRKKGLNTNPSLAEASLAQRLAFGSRLTTIPLKGFFQRQAAQRREPLSPDIVNTEFLISGEIERTNNEVPYSGMILAQGNKKNGYGLYLLGDKLYFRVNQAGKAFQAVTTKPLPARFIFKAALQRNGRMRLSIDSGETVSAKASGLFSASPETPLRIGIDWAPVADKVGVYPDSAFVTARGITMHNLMLETLDPINVSGNVTGKIDKVIVLKVLKNVMKYDKQLITAKAGTTIQIVLQNPDFMQHNLVLIRPRTTNRVGSAADMLVRNPNGAKMNYVPKMPEILKATPLINPGGKYTMTVKLPDVPGDYPYLCTFPGHWRIMKGILRVTR